MPRYTVREQEQVHVSIGDLRNQINVISMALTPSSTDSVDVTEIGRNPWDPYRILSRLRILLIS